MPLIEIKFQIDRKELLKEKYYISEVNPVPLPDQIYVYHVTISYSDTVTRQYEIPRTAKGTWIPGCTIVDDDLAHIIKTKIESLEQQQGQ
jgi:hypothetical protein